MSAERPDGFDRERAEKYIELHPDASVPEVLGQLGLSPAHRSAIEQMVGVEGEDPAATEAAGSSEQPRENVDEGTPRKDRPVDPAEHYARLEELYGTLGEIGSGALCIGNHDFKGWYRINEDVPGDWEGKGRGFALGKEFDDLRDRLDRVLYSTINYAAADWYLDAWDRYRWDDGREWESGTTPLPEYGDLRAISPFADIDLADDVKEDRPTGDVPKEGIETAIERYIEAFADLAGGREHVFVLDSVGGVYVMVAPTATEPIADEFDYEARDAIFSEMVDRMNDWLDDVRTDVEVDLPEIGEVFSPDLLNNKNRLYKAPLSLHKSLDGTVTPMDPANPSYDFTPSGAVDETMIEESEEWAAEFTGDHQEAVRAIVSALWPDEYAEAGSWSGALRSWTEAKREEEREREERRKEVEEERENRLEDLNASVSGQSVTPHLEDLTDTIDQIDMKALVKKHCAEWEPTPESGSSRENHFNPGRRLWKDSDSGTSCFVNTTKNIFVDVGDNGGKGGPVKFMALKSGEINHPSQSASGETYWKGVEELRKDGYDIPVWVPAAGSERSNGEVYEKTPYWVLRKAAVALNVLPENGFVAREGEDGGTYQGFPGRVTFDRTLDELEDLGIDHGWTRDGESENTHPTRAELGLESDPDGEDEEIEQFLLELHSG